VNLHYFRIFYGGGQYLASSSGPRRLASMLFAVEIANLPAVNAALNAVAATLLVAGYVAIKLGRAEKLHRNLMLTAFGVSVLFLGCYLTYHALTTVVNKFPLTAPTAVRYTYYLILFTHIILAATVPFLASFTIWLGLKGRRERHRRWARWTFPIWLYVSITGVIIYFLLYQLYPPVAA